MPSLVWIFLSVTWGLTWLAVRIGLDDLPPFTFAAIRFGGAAALLLLVMGLRGLSLPRARRDWSLIGQTAFLTIGLGYSLQFWGQQYVPSGLTAVLFATVPLFTFVLAHRELPAEPLTRAKLSGVILGIAGVALIFGNQLAVESPLAVIGCLGFLVASAAMAFAQVRVKGRGSHIDPLTLAALQMAIGSFLLLALALVLEGDPRAIDWTLKASASLAYLSVIGSALAFFLFYWLLRHMEVGKVMSMTLAHPVVAVVAGWAVLDERLNWRILVGGSTVLIGLWLVLRPRRV